MKRFTTILLAVVGTTTAQTTTVVEVLNPYFGHNPYDASVVDANPTATTYAMYCQKNSTNYHCREDPTGLILTLVGGPSTVEVHVERPASEISIEYIGTISGDRMDCQKVMTKSGRTLQMADVFLTPLTNSDFRVPLTVTAGIEKLLAQAIATATTEPSGAQTGPTATGAQATPTPTANAAMSSAGREGLLAAFAGGVFAAGVVMA